MSNGISDIDVPGDTVDLGQLGLAVMAKMPIGSGVYIAFAEPTLDWTFAGSQIARDDPLTGSLALGVRRVPRSAGMDLWRFALTE